MSSFNNFDSSIFVYFAYDLNYLKYYPYLILIFLIGLIDDYGFKINPNIRLLFLFITQLYFFIILI